MPPKSFSDLSVSKRELLLGALASAVTLATPQSRLLAASNTHPVKLPLEDGRTLEVDQEKVYLRDRKGRHLVKSGNFALGNGGRIEVRGGKLLSAVTRPGDIFVEATWIEVHSPPGGSKPNAGAKTWLRNNGARQLNQ